MLKPLIFIFLVSLSVAYAEDSQLIIPNLGDEELYSQTGDLQLGAFTTTSPGTVSNASGNTTPPGGGGGGGGDPTNQVTRHWKILAGTSNWNIKHFIIPITYVKLDVGMNTLPNVNLTIQTVDNWFMGRIPGKNFYVSEFNTNIPPKTIDSIIIGFRVDKKWIIDNNFVNDEITLWRYTEKGVWVPLITRTTGENVRYIYYEADSPGFSYFAISSGRENVITPPEPLPPSRELTEEVKVPVITGEATTVEPSKRDYSGVLFMLGMIFFSLLLLVALAAQLRNRTTFEMTPKPYTDEGLTNIDNFLTEAENIDHFLDKAEDIDNFLERQ